MKQVGSALWLHGYGTHPGFDELCAAASETAYRHDIALEIPPLNRRQQDPDRVVVPSLDEQIEKVKNYLDRGPDEIICHSFGGLILALACCDRTPSAQQLSLLAPPLNVTSDRFIKDLRRPTDHDQIEASAFGGAYGRLGWMWHGQAQTMVVSNDFIEGVSPAHIKPLALIGNLLGKFAKPQIFRPGLDERLGDQADQYGRLGELATCQIIDVPNASHRFRGMELEIASDALLGLEI
ncbi:MAG: hypothetical protein ACREGA_02135 [Candidatus Saccharimonadales bacterium]